MKTMDLTIGVRHSAAALLGRTARQSSSAASVHAGHVLVGRKRDSQFSRACSSARCDKTGTCMGSAVS